MGGFDVVSYSNVCSIGARGMCGVRSRRRVRCTSTSIACFRPMVCLRVSRCRIGCAKQGCGWLVGWLRSNVRGTGWLMAGGSRVFRCRSRMAPGGSSWTSSPRPMRSPLARTEQSYPSVRRISGASLAGIEVTGNPWKGVNSMNTVSVDAVLFDLDGTLIDHQSAAAAAVTATFLGNPEPTCRTRRRLALRHDLQRGRCSQTRRANLRRSLRPART